MGHYELLGLTQEATDEEIRKAFRKLSKVYHPDMPTGDQEKFIQLKEAYEVLSDPDEKASYDSGVKTSEDGKTEYRSGQSTDIFSDVFRTRTDIDTPLRGQNRQAKLTISFLEAATGVTKNVVMRVMQECQDCSGMGKTGEVDVCPDCNGTKIIKSTVTNPMGYTAETKRRCLTCKDWEEETVECRPCRGTGKKRTTVTVEVRVPAGIKNESRIRVKGVGEPGINGGESGDLMVTVIVEEDSDYKREGDNLELTVHLKYSQLVLGDSIEIPALDGGTRQINIPPFTEPGTKLTIKGGGMKSPTSIKTGDLIILLRLDMPRELTEEQQEVLRNLGL